MAEGQGQDDGAKRIDPYKGFFDDVPHAFADAQPQSEMTQALPPPAPPQTPTNGGGGNSPQVRNVQQKLENLVHKLRPEEMEKDWEKGKQKRKEELQKRVEEFEAKEFEQKEKRMEQRKRKLEEQVEKTKKQKEDMEIGEDN